MRVEYLRTARHSYMLVKEADYALEQYEIQMILNNEIPCLLPMQIIVGDGQVEYWYDVTGMQSLEKQFSLEPITFEKLRFLLLSICDMKLQMENYMLDDRNIHFNAAYVFFDRVQKTLRFCYIPGYQQTQSAGITGLFEQVLQYLDHTDSQAVRLGYDLYEHCSQNGFVAAECRQCLKEAAEKGQEQSEFQAERTMAAASELPELEPAMENENKRASVGKERKKAKRKWPLNYRRILEKEQKIDYVAEKQETWNQTVYFSAEQMKTVWELSYQGDGLEDNFRVEKNPFLIGKDPARADGILHADTVSRIHAQISEREGTLYLEDYNSTNGTYLNGKLLPMNTPVKLQKGDQIVFATEPYLLVDRRISKC